MKRFFTLFITLMMVFGMTTFAGAILIGGDLGGVSVIYDSDQDITWIADAGYGGTGLDWDSAKNWAAGLTYGSADWSLPSTDNAAAWDCYIGTCTDTDMAATSELAYLYYEYGINKDNSGPFTNLQTKEFTYYWSKTAASYDSDGNPLTAWHFSFYDGIQEPCGTGQTGSCYAIAVTKGNIADVVVPVPEPSTLLLLGSGLVGVVALRRRRRRATKTNL